MEFLLNFNSWFKGLPASGKLSFYLVVIGMVVAGILLQQHYKTAGHQYLYTNLSLSDANAIAARLQSMNVEAQVQGDAVLVPGNRVLELRNTLSAEGLPRGGGVGFEIFDQKNFGETEFQQRVNYMRAVQGELARTISAIDGVEKARVHIVMPEKSLFAEDANPPTASVAIQMLKGRKLSDGQINGIAHMLVTSVEGLTENNLNIIDQNGNVLYKGSGSDKSAGSTKQLDMQADLEARMERGVRDMLERIVGAGGATVKVSTVLNFNTVEKMVEAIDPESRVALSENATTETQSGTSGSAGGTPGAASNLPEAGGTGASGSSSSNSKRVETTANYTVTKTTQKIVEPMGAIQKLSVAVLVDGTYQTAEDGTQTYQPRTAEEIAKLETLVKNAVGFNDKRGDAVKIENMQFNRLPVDDKGTAEFVSATNSSRFQLFLFDNAKLLGVVLILGVIFIMLVKLVNSYAPPVNVAYANLIGQSAAAVADALPARAQINIVQRDSGEAKQKAQEIANQMPDMAQRRDSGMINFVETEKSITVEAMTTSEEKLRLQAAKLQAESIMKNDVNETVGIVRQWLNEG